MGLKKNICAASVIKYLQNCFFKKTKTRINFQGSISNNQFNRKKFQISNLKQETIINIQVKSQGKN